MRGERLSQRVSAVTPLGEALDGTPTKKRRAAAKNAPKPVIGTSFVCHCGERFDDLREAWVHVRAEYGDLRKHLSELRKVNGHLLIAACGTYSGYRRHQRAGELPCQACNDARRIYDRQQKRDRIARMRIDDPAGYERFRDRQRSYLRAYRERQKEDGATA